ncbi:MAG: site-specific DNA-methyltransferase [Pseudomonadota bacterium]
MTAAGDIVQIGGITLIHGDAFDHLPTFVGQCDLLCTDHPYRLTSGGCAAPGEGPMSGMFDASDYDNSGDLMAIVEWSQTAGPIYRALKPDADAYVMVNDKNLALAHGAFIGAGFALHNVLVWDKGAPTRNRWYMKNLEFTLYFWKGRADKPINNPGSTQLWREHRPPNRVHPTQKPVCLMRHYIANSSQPDDVVLDPYMGSGSTLVAAAQEGRRGIGIEINAEHFANAVDRVREVAE